MTYVIIYVGPVITVSTTKLIMTYTSENCATKKRIKLINESAVRAIFMFDIDLYQNSFKVDPQQGHIGPHSRKHITITFLPQKVGLYTRHLPCLILNHVMGKIRNFINFLYCMDELKIALFYSKIMLLVNVLN
jgi:hypothetical protein